LEIYCM